MNLSFRFVSFICLLGAASLGGCASVPPPAPQEKKKEPVKAEPTVDPRYAALPVPTAAPDWTPPTATKVTLTNGLSLWQMNYGATPLVSIHLVLPTGSAFDPPEKAGLSLVSADLLDEGAGRYSALELSDRLGELATDYNASAGVDYVLLSMEALSENLGPSLELLADIVRRPRLSQTEFDRRKKHHLAVAVSSEDDPAASRSKALARVLFGDGYAGLPPSGTKSSLNAINFNDVKKRVKELTVPEGAHLVIAGMVESEEASALTSKFFGDWKGTRLKQEPNVNEPAHGKKAYVVDFEGAAQSSLAIAMRAGANSDPNYFAEEVMNQKLGESFTGRINMNLREDKGYTYGAFSQFRRYDRAGYYALASDVKSENTGDSIREVFSELTDLCGARPLTEIERDESVEGLLLGYPMTFDEVGSLGYRLVTLPLHKRPVDFWSNWPEEIKTITTARANEAARPYCNTEHYQVVIAGDQKTLVPQLKSLGFEVVVLDRDGLLPQGSAIKEDH